MAKSSVKRASPAAGPLDRFDVALLEALQRNGRLTSQELAEEVGLSASQCARRRQRLEDDGYIRGYRALVDRKMVGAAVEVFIQVVMSKHSKDDARSFIRVVETTPSILDAWTLTGASDYLLRVAVPDLDALNVLINDVLLRQPVVNRVQSQVVLSDLKTLAPVPIRGGRP